MIYSVLADITLLVHLGFIVFAAAGGLLLHRYPWLAWLHAPAVLWGVGIELLGGICPVTPLENHLRRLGGEAGYSGGFVEHYLAQIVYPDGLTRQTQVMLGLGLGVVNLAAYAHWWWRRGKA
ncbi:MAG: DUF2784 domain-containing protein [Quisquiliibacterium sp.]